MAENENPETPENAEGEAPEEVGQVEAAEAEATGEAEAAADADAGADADAEPDTDAGDAPAAAPAPVSKREQRKQARHEAASKRPQRSPEERHAERREERAKKAAARRRRRLQEREKHRATRGEVAPTPPVEKEHGRKKVRQGVVVSAKADKTITVRIDSARRHPRYEKIVRSSVTLHAHDEGNEANEGDTVRVVESRPLSRTKRWRLEQVVERAR